VGNYFRKVPFQGKVVATENIYERAKFKISFNLHISFEKDRKMRPNTV
jgi:hypothetical protein